MARSKRVPIGTVRPYIEIGGTKFGAGGKARQVVPPTPGHLWIGSDDPIIDVVAQLTGKARVSPPRPRYEQDERYGDFALPRYAGHDPYTLELPIKMDGRPRHSVDRQVADLERLAERQPGTLEPPLVKVIGRSVRHTGFRWRVTEIDEDHERAIYDGDNQALYVATVTLTQHIADEQLAMSLRRSKGKGLSNRQTRVKDSEDSLYDVARRIYRDPSRAGDIARANPGVRLGERLKPGRMLRLPS